MFGGIDMKIPLFVSTLTYAWSLMNAALSAFCVMYAAAVIARIRSRIKKEHKSGVFRPGWLAMAIVLCIVSVILTVLTQEMKGQMVLLDQWTITFAAIFVLEIMAVAFVFEPG